MPARNTSTKRTNHLRDRLLNRTVIAALLFCLVFGGVGGYLVRSSFADDFSCAPNTYEEGSEGVCVKVIQEIVNQAVASNLPHSGAYKLTVDGDYGPLTAKAVLELQRDTVRDGYPSNEIDGVAGPNTWHYTLCWFVNLTGPLWLNNQANCQKYDE
jgi:hypothetical protein